MEPERPIEKLLRAFARKRRGQAGDPPGFDLHPATRRLLQGEVARRSPRQRDGNFFLRLLALVRPRLALALSVTALMIISAALLLPSLSASKSRSKLASAKVVTFTESQQVEQSAATTPAAGAPATAPPVTVALDRDSSVYQKKLDTPAGEELKNRPEAPVIRSRRADASDRLEIVSQGANSSEAQVKTATASGVDNGPLSSGATGRIGAELAFKLETDSRVAAQANAAAPASAGGLYAGTSNYSFADARSADRKSQVDDLGSTAATATRPGFAGQGGGGGGAATQMATALFYTLNDEVRSANESNLNRQKFIQWNGDAAALVVRSNASPVLTNFAVEQNGRQMRVVDHDGSVYDGYLQRVREPAVALSGQPAPARELLVKDAADKEKAPESVGNYFFRVAGTNRSLKQNVVFTGNFVNLTNNANFVPPAGTTALGTRAQDAYDATSAVLQQLPLQNSLINGTIQINNTREMQIQAMPASPAPPAPQR